LRARPLSSPWATGQRCAIATSASAAWSRIIGIGIIAIGAAGYFSRSSRGRGTCAPVGSLPAFKNGCRGHQRGARRRIRTARARRYAAATRMHTAVWIIYTHACIYTIVYILVGDDLTSERAFFNKPEIYVTVFHIKINFRGFPAPDFLAGCCCCATSTSFVQNCRLCRMAIPWPGLQQEYGRWWPTLSAGGNRCYWPLAASFWGRRGRSLSSREGCPEANSARVVF
jgi:hypothetical protein